MRSNIDMAPMVPMTTNPTIYTTRTDGGDDAEQRFERPPETTGAEADRHREEVEPGVADLR